MRTLILFLLGVALLSASTGDALALEYRARALCAIGSGPLGFDINNSNQVLVRSLDTPGFARVLNPDGTSTGNPTPPPFVVAFNDACTAVGSTHPSAMTWNENTGICDLAEPAGHSYSGARAINESGQVAGWCGGESVPCVWSSEGEPTVLPTLPSYSMGAAWCLNDLGVAGGWCGDYWSRHEACIWSAAGSVMSLGISGKVYAINNRGQAVGRRDEGDGGAFFWSTETGVIDLGEGQALGINDSGVVVGCTGKPYWQVDFDMADESGSKAFVWTAQTGRSELSPPAPQGLLVGTGACAINDAGLIVGWTTSLRYRGRAVLWEPVPEPGSGIALALGLIGTMIARRRRS